MIDFFKTQMDYIQFFYGLAFITLASVCFIMVRGKESRLPWVWLGLFGLTHGIYEWLDMAEDFVGEGQLLNAVNLLFGVVSFIFLAEFGRSGTARLQGRGQGRSIFLPLLILSGLGVFGGWDGLTAAYRLTLGLVGGLWASYALFLAAKCVEKPAGRWLASGGVAVGLYGITAGLVGPYAHFFPATLLNGEVFFRVCGFPVQLVRGSLAIATAVSVWVYSQVPTGVKDGELTRPKRPRHTFIPVVLLLCIIAAGWVLTQFAGNHARDEQIKTGNLLVSSLRDNLAYFMEDARHAALERAASPPLAAALLSGSSLDIERARIILGQSSSENNARPYASYLFNNKGELILSYGYEKSADLVRLFLRHSRAEVGGYFVADSTSHRGSYIASAPVWDDRGRILGTTVVQVNLKEIEAWFRKYPSFFLIDNHGIVLLSNDDRMFLRSLWPLPTDVQKKIAASSQFGSGPFNPVVSNEVVDGGHVTFDGKQFLVTRRFLGNDGWSIVLLNSTGHVSAYRLFSIFTTFVFFGLTFLFFGALHFTREAAAKISASERRYRSLVEGSPDGIILFDERGRCLTINSAGLSLIDRAENEVIGKGLNELLAGENRRNLDQDLERVLQGTMISFETEIVRSYGKRMTWSVILNPVYDFDGVIRRFMGIIVDVTDRRYAEATLKKSETNFRELSQQFHTLLDAIPDILLLLSPDLKVLWANRGAAFRLGMEISAMKGKYCYELWHRRSTGCEDCHVMRTFQTGEAEISQRTTANGRLFESKSFPIKDETGNVSNVIQIISDVTEKVTLRAEAMRASHLASLGELAAGVAHEINNPINGIINYAQILVNSLERERREGEIAGRIIKEGNRVAGIVRSLLSFARERKEGKAPVSVVKILHEAITLTEAQIRKDGTHLKIHLPPDLPEIIASQQQIEQVFLNLISNARYALNKKYPGTHEDKHLEISGEKIVSDGSSYVRVTFHDKGTGIPAEIFDKVMNPFFSTKPSGEGTGLGLSISHGIVRDHGGRILIESSEGKFTTIMVHLPFKEKDGR